MMSVMPVALTALAYDYVPDMLERRAPHREAHLALVNEWSDRGDLAIAGALGDPPHGAFFGFTADAERVAEFVAADPYVAADLVVAYRIEPWTVVAHRPLEG
jgi:uncharacterized protein YciI